MPKSFKLLRLHANRFDSCLDEGKHPPPQSPPGCPWGRAEAACQVGGKMPCSSLLSLGESTPNVETYGKKKKGQNTARRAGVRWAGVLLNGLLNHPAWALFINPCFPAGAGAQSAGRCCFPGEELAVPRARERWCSWTELQLFQHNVSPGFQPPELAPLAAYCVRGGGFGASVNLFSSFPTPGHFYRSWMDVAFSQQGLALEQVG